MNTSTAPDQMYGYDVLDQTGSKIGDVDGVWVDDATNQLEFVGVKTGFFMGKTHLIPVENAQIGDGTITIPFSKDQVHDAPSFGTDDELSPDDENQIYSYYGMDRSTAPSPTGLGAGTGTTDTTYTDQNVDTTNTTGQYNTGTTTDYNTTDTGDRELVLSEEELQVGKRQVEAGRVRLRKIVRTEHVTEPVELRREDIEIERVDASGASVPSDAFQEETIDVPVMREEAVVAKEAHVTGRVRVEKDVDTETQNVEGDIRREDVEVDRDVDTSGVRASADTYQSGTTGGYTSTDTTTDDTTNSGNTSLRDRARNLVDGDNS